MNGRQDGVRRRWISYWRGWRKAGEFGRRGYPPAPVEFADLRCGAQTRAGTPCKMKALYDSGRCKLHGGLSTGPKSEEGKARARENGKLGGRGRRAKPKTMNDMTKRQPPSEVKVVPIAEPESLGKPNPMNTLRFRQGTALASRQAKWRAFCAERGIQLPTWGDLPLTENIDRAKIGAAPLSRKR